MAGQFVAQLDDVFAQIGFNRNDPVLFQMVVDRDFFPDHRLALGDRLRARLLADRQHRRPRSVGVGAPMHRAAGFFYLGLVRFKVEVEIGQRVVFDVARGVAQRLELRQSLHRRRPARHEARPRARERLLQPGIGQGTVSVFLESGRGGDMHGDGWLLRHGV